MIGPRNPVCQALHAAKYRQSGETFDDYCVRYARTTADDEAHFRQILAGVRSQSILPAGRQQRAVGWPFQTTAFNCFVAGTIRDDTRAIGNAVTDAMMTLRSGGGCGWDFSPIRPAGEPIRQLGDDAYASGPVSFMGIWHAMCNTIRSAGERRGAMMAVLRVDHPDILKFIRAKENEQSLTNFNISVGITNEFMAAVEADALFPLKFEGRTLKTVRALDVWSIIMENNWDWAEPGVLFLDTINGMNPLYYCEQIAATNPCVVGETLIAVAGRGAVPIRQLAEEGKDVPVYAVDRTTGETVVKWGRKPRLTGRNVPLVKVTLDDGSTIRCTPNHSFPLRDGRKVEAKDLKAGDSLYRIDTTIQANGEVYVDGKKEEEWLSEEKPQSRVAVAVRVAEVTPAESWTDQPLVYEEATANHKVVSVEPDGYGDVYNLTVDDVHTYGVYTTITERKKGSSTYQTLSGVKVCNCGEQPLPPDGACLLLSLNVVKYLVPSYSKPKINPRTGQRTYARGYEVDLERFAHDVAVAVRACDNVFEKTVYPLEAQQREAFAKRRMGVGVTGVANALEVCGLRYGTAEYLLAQDRILEILRDTAYRTSIDMAKVKGSFPLFDADKWLASGFARTLPDDIRADIKKHGLRNGLLLSIAPTGTISLTADNVSSGIEPPPLLEMNRVIQYAAGPRTVPFNDYALEEYGVRCLTAAEVSPQRHVAVLCAAQKWVDSSISKTINLAGASTTPAGPGETTFAEFQDVYLQAFRGGAKGCTTYNSNGRRRGIFEARPTEEAGPTGAFGTAGASTDTVVETAVLHPTPEGHERRTTPTTTPAQGSLVVNSAGGEPPPSFGAGAGSGPGAGSEGEPGSGQRHRTAQPELGVVVGMEQMCSIDPVTGARVCG